MTDQTDSIMDYKQLDLALLENFMMNLSQWIMDMLTALCSFKMEK